MKKRELFRNFDDLPDSALVSVDIVAELLDIHINSVWRHVKAGKLPAPVKISSQTTRWRVGDLRKHIAKL